MEALGSLLEAKYGTGAVLWRLKPNHAALGPKGFIDEIAGEADAVINGLCS